MSLELKVHPEVDEALRSHKPVVLLETAVLTCGLPRSTWPQSFGAAPSGLSSDEPMHLGTLHAMAAAVRETGSVPAITAILDGQPCVGLDDAMLTRLAMDDAGEKASAASIATCMADQLSAGTTVSATLHLGAALAENGRDIPRVFATGGIGGVHLGWPDKLDMSADLMAIARTQICVLCSGPKSIIDDVTTAEAMEALGIPVLGYQTDFLPGFQATTSSGHHPIHRVDDLSAIDRIAKAHWSLPQSGGILLCQPAPSQSAMPIETVRSLAEVAELQIKATGPARTPALLTHMAENSGGRTLRANIELLISNASTAGSLANSMT